jgi:hypothetical protein
MARIKLPHKALGTFISAANSWLSRTIDAKTTGLEVCFQNLNGKFHVSVGADSNYIEAVLTVDPADIAALVQPVFLDLPSLAAYGFDADGLTMVVPVTEAEMKVDQRVTFSVPGFNLRVPRKKGEIWKRNTFKLENIPIDGLVLDKEGFEILQKFMYLPDSFKVEGRAELQVVFDVSPKLGYKIHFYDGFGAFCHTFTNDKLVGQEGRLTFLEDFFTPCEKFVVDSQIAFSMTDRQCFGTFSSESTGMEVLRWTQPRQQRTLNETAMSIQKKRMLDNITLLIKPEEVIGKITKACILFSPAEIREIPIEMDVVGTQYELIARKPSGEGEVRAAGELLLQAPQNLNIALQAACWKSYLSQFDKKGAVNMEVFGDSVILSQKTEGRDLIYWMPVPPRAGARRDR